MEKEKELEEEKDLTTKTLVKIARLVKAIPQREE